MSVVLKHPALPRRKTFPNREAAARYFAVGWTEEGSTSGPVIPGPLYEVVADGPEWLDIDETWVSFDLVKQVPEGPIPEVLAWVDDNPDRARAALVVERETSARSTLIAQLEQIASSETHDTPQGEKETDI